MRAWSAPAVVPSAICASARLIPRADSQGSATGTQAANASAAARAGRRRDRASGEELTVPEASRPTSGYAQRVSAGTDQSMSTSLCSARANAPAAIAAPAARDSPFSRRSPIAAASSAASSASAPGIPPARPVPESTCSATECELGVACSRTRR